MYLNIEYTCSAKGKCGNAGYIKRNVDEGDLSRVSNNIFELQLYKWKFEYQ